MLRGGGEQQGCRQDNPLSPANSREGALGVRNEAMDPAGTTGTHALQQLHPCASTHAPAPTCSSCSRSGSRSRYRSHSSSSSVVPAQRARQGSRIGGGSCLGGAEPHLRACALGLWQQHVPGTDCQAVPAVHGGKTAAHKAAQFQCHPPSSCSAWASAAAAAAALGWRRAAAASVMGSSSSLQGFRFQKLTHELEPQSRMHQTDSTHAGGAD